MTDEVMREIDQDIRNEKMRKLWKRYRGMILGTVVALVVITAGSSVYGDYQSKKAGEAMLALDAGIQQLQDGNAEDAAGKFKALAKRSSGELNDIARLWQARAQAHAGDAKATLATLNDLAAKPASKSLVWRDMACLRLMAAGADAPAACDAKQDSPLRAQRLEWRAATLWEQGKNDEARALLKTVADDETIALPQRERARTLMRALPEKAA